MKISIRHQLQIALPAGSARAVEHLLLTPVSGPTQIVREWAVEMPGIDTAARFVDAFGNRALLVNQSKPAAEIAVTVTGIVETIDRNGVLGRIAGEPVVALYRRPTPLTEPDPRILDGFREAQTWGAARIALFHALMERIGELYSFSGAGEEDPPSESEVASQSQTQSQDGQSQRQGTTSVGAEPAPAADHPRPPADATLFAHQFIATLRALGIPARYVTGYLAGEDERPAAFHAWAEAYDDGLGWIGFDAALGICPTDRHVRVAAGLDAACHDAGARRAAGGRTGARRHRGRRAVATPTTPARRTP